MINAYCYFIPAGIGEDAIITAAKSLHVQNFKRGDVILEENEVGDAFFILEEGVVSVTVSKLNFLCLFILMHCFHLD